MSLSVIDRMECVFQLYQGFAAVNVPRKCGGITSVCRRTSLYNPIFTESEIGFWSKAWEVKKDARKKKKSSFTKGYSGKLMLTVFGFYVVLMVWTRNENSNMIRYPYTVTLPQDGQML